ncbi:SERPINE1 mRNA-binding protein 1 isoform X1 [Petromyzon marinus]|uniref:Plasminogen activator inhibitor 1 RNA-binding protein isoform X1 n=1 Tax=Petromyzon marinus TaxID=7757 RepID=A0AAJ7TQ12_PETMA|nr:plasminogen activator inhibitor 1 RNA-binding protein isoform X1 [Petromyzon marinus]
MLRTAVSPAPAILAAHGSDAQAPARRIGESVGIRALVSAIMPGNLQEGFGCVINNRFEQLLDDETDPFELLKEAQQKKELAGGGSAKAAAKAGPPGTKPPPKKESQRDRRAPTTGQATDAKPAEQPAPTAVKRAEGSGPRRIGRRPDQQGPFQGPFQGQGGQGQGGPGQGGQGQGGEGRPERRGGGVGFTGEGRPERRGGGPRPERRFAERLNEERPDGSTEMSSENRSMDRPPRGRGNFRGFRGRGRGIGRNPDGFDGRGKREFERHSGSDKTGLKPEDKRGGSGSHNWGNAKDDASEIDQPAATEEHVEHEEVQTTETENKENETDETKDEEEGSKEMTLDEWKAVQEKARAKAQFNIRKPGEGCDSAQWGKSYVMRKTKPVEGEVQLESTADHHFRRSSNDITSKLEINFGDHSRRGRGGRGGGAPRGGRGGGAMAGPPGAVVGGPGVVVGAPGTAPAGPSASAIVAGAPGPSGMPPPRGGGRGMGRGAPRGERPSAVIVPNVDDPEAFPALA